MPGSGKSTIGCLVAEALALPFFDKDEVLESLFETLGVGDSSWRTRMSRAADEVLKTLVQQSAGAVVVSWWRDPRNESSWGTETTWLNSLPGKVVELHCQCTPELAVERFFSRSRHAGHLDNLKSRSEELTKFNRAAALGPLGVVPVIVCRTELRQNLPLLIEALNEHAG